MSSAFKVVLACVLYGTSSSLSTLSSKSIFNDYGLTPYYCIFLQAIFLIFLLLILPKVINAFTDNKTILSALKNVPRIKDLTDSKKVMPGLMIGIGNTAFAISGFYAVHYVSIPM
jgi:hypothetical protein